MRRRSSEYGRRASGPWPRLLLSHVAKLEEYHQGQAREDEEGDRATLSEVAALETDLVRHGSEEMGRVDRASARQHLDDIEVAEGEDRRKEDDHGQHRLDE